MISYSWHKFVMRTLHVVDNVYQFRESDIVREKISSTFHLLLLILSIGKWSSMAIGSETMRWQQKTDESVSERKSCAMVSISPKGRNGRHSAILRGLMDR